jgi:hypothetical protein
MAGQIGTLGEVLSQQAVRILVGASLPRALRVTEVDFHIGRDCKALVLGHLFSLAPRQRASQGGGQFAHVANRHRRASCPIIEQLESDIA